MGLDKLPKIPAINSSRVLSLNPQLAKDLVDNDYALDHGFTALALAFDEIGQVLRREAVETIIDELDLQNFVRHQSYYESASKVATVILQGMVKKGWIARWNCPQRKQNRMRATTKGYLLTPNGRKKLQSLMSMMPDSLLRRLEHRIIKPGVIEIFDKAEKDELKSSELPDIEKKVAANLPTIEKLLANYDSVEQSLSEWRRLEETRLFDIESIEAEISRLQTEKNKAINDLTDCRQIIAEEEIKLEGIKQQIQQLVVKGDEC